MPRKQFSIEYGDYGDDCTEDGEFLSEIARVGERHGYAIQELTVQELPQTDEDDRWYDDTR